jgi:hypothetical protein
MGSVDKELIYGVPLNENRRHYHESHLSKALTHMEMQHESRYLL